MQSTLGGLSSLLSAIEVEDRIFQVFKLSMYPNSMLVIPLQFSSISGTRMGFNVLEFQEQWIRGLVLNGSRLIRLNVHP